MERGGGLRASPLPARADVLPGGGGEGERGSSATYPPLADGSIPHYVGATPEPEGHRQQLWTEGTDPNGDLSSECAKTMFCQDEEVDDAN